MLTQSWKLTVKPQQLLLIYRLIRNPSNVFSLCWNEGQRNTTLVDVITNESRRTNHLFRSWRRCSFSVLTAGTNLLSHEGTCYRETPDFIALVSPPPESPSEIQVQNTCFFCPQALTVNSSPQSRTCWCVPGLVCRVMVPPRFTDTQIRHSWREAVVKLVAYLVSGIVAEQLVELQPTTVVLN